MSQYIIHAAPYSSPNSSKIIKSNWAVQNLKVFQENPSAGGGVFAKFDLVNTSNPKDKKYTMNFSFADGTSMTANAINRIRRFFNEAYDRQRSSSYGFPQLTDTDKTQIVARINTAYNQFAGFSHSDLEHSLPVGTRIEDVRRNYIYTKSEMEYSTGRYANSGTSVVVYFKPTEKPLDRTQTPDPYYAKIPVDSIPLRGNRPAYIKQQLKKWFSDFLITISDSELNKATYGALEVATPAINERLSTVDSKPQHPGYYSPNLKHSGEDADVIDCTSDHIEHAMSNVSYTRRYGFGGEPNYGTLTVTRERGEADLYVVTLERKGARFQFYVKPSYSVDEIKQHLRSASDKILATDESNNTANLIKAVLREAVSKYSSQHTGYYSPNLKHSEPDYLSVKMSAIDDLDDNYLEHHGVKGMKWGVINEKPTDPRQRTGSSSGHPYYSPNTGNSSNSTNSVVKRDTNPGKNTSTSTNKTYYTADLSQKPLSDKDGVHYVIGMGNSGYGAQITVPSNVITSTLDRKEDLAAMVKSQVIQGVNSFRNNPRYGEPYKHFYLTDKQIDSIVWSLVYKIEKDWKKNYYKPGRY